VAEWRSGDARKGNRKKERLTTRAVPHKGGAKGEDAMQQLQTRRQLPGACAFRARVWSFPPPSPRFILPLRLCFTRVAAVATAIAEEEADGALEPLSGESSIPPLLPRSPNLPARPRVTPSRRARSTFHRPRNPQPGVHECAREPSGYSASVQRISSYASVLFPRAGKVDLPRSRGRQSRAMREESRGNLTFIVAFIAISMT